MKKIFLSPSGRMGRRNFWIGVTGLTLFVCVVNFYLRTFPALELSFWVGLVFPFLFLHMTYAIYGTRLHDMGRSFWPLTLLIVSIILLTIFIMLAFGGAEYFSEFAQYERKAVIDEAERERLINQYQENLANSHANTLLSLSSMGLIIAFTIWCGLSKPDPNTNRYGQPL